MARSRYRPFHLLLVNLPRRYSPPEDSRIAQTLQNWFGNERVQDRVLLMGTKLNDTLGGSDRSLRDAFDSVVTSLATAEEIGRASCRERVEGGGGGGGVI